MSKAAISAMPLVVDEITLDGKRVQVQSVDLPLEQVTLDPRNPRIANTALISISEEGEALQKKLEALLWEDADVRDLYRQVLINQGLVERIIVRQDGKCRRRKLPNSCLSKASRKTAFRGALEEHPCPHIAARYWRP